MRLKVITLIIVTTLAFNQLGKSQCLSINLIKNSGFEDYVSCPYDLNLIYFAKYWTQPLPTGYCTSDYFNKCGLDSIIDSTLLLFYNQHCFENGYAGIGIIQNIPNSTNYREYIQGEISESLIAGKCYYADLWVKPFNHYPMGNSFSGIDAISIYFSDTLPKATSVYSPFFFNAQINNPNGNIIIDTLNWTKISGRFTANGGEKYLTVGCFKPQSQVNIIYFNSFSPNYSYYFFDNFSLCPCEDTIPPKEPDQVLYIPNIFSPNNDGQNDKLFVRGQQIESLHFLIYNRWGNLVFESNDINQGWDGTQNGKKCETGVYVYRAEVTFKNGEKVVKRGDVTVVR